MRKFISPTFLTGFILAVMSGATLMWISEEVNRQSTRISEIENRISDKNEEIRYLQAEWAYLNRPDRLYALLEGLETPFESGLPIDAMPEGLKAAVPPRKPDSQILATYEPVTSGHDLTIASVEQYLALGLQDDRGGR